MTPAEQLYGAGSPTSHLACQPGIHKAPTKRRFLAVVGVARLSDSVGHLLANPATSGPAGRRTGITSHAPDDGPAMTTDSPSGCTATGRTAQAFTYMH